MLKSLDQAMSKIVDKKKAIEIKEIEIRKKEKQLRTKKLIEIGKIASKSGLDNIDLDVLLGAFLELNVLATDENNVTKWSELSLKFRNTDSSKNKNALIVSTNASTSNETKVQLRKMGFKWNKFREEWYGYGNKEEVAKIVGPSAKIETC